MTTLITGGTGLMGALIAERLVERGERPVLFDNNPAMWRLKGFEDKVDVVRGNVVNLHEILSVIKKYKVTKVIHLAFMLGAESDNDPLAASYVNIIGTVNMYEAGRLEGLERVCVASSISLFGCDDEYPPEELPLTEDKAKHLGKGMITYAAGKLYMEAVGNHYRERFGVFVCGLRPAIVYGWGRSTGATVFAGELIEKPALGLPVSVKGGNAAASMVYVKDIVDMWLLIHDLPKEKFKRYFYNSGGDKVTVKEIAEIVKKFVPDAQINVECGDERYVAGLTASFSDRLIGEELGYKRKYTPIEKGIGDMIEEVRRRAKR